MTCCVLREVCKCITVFVDSNRYDVLDKMSLASLRDHGLKYCLEHGTRFFGFSISGRICSFYGVCDVISVDKFVNLKVLKST